VRIFAIDPGGTTGIAVSTYDDASSIEDFNYFTTDLGPEKHHVHLWNSLSAFQPDVVVCESFQFRQNYNRDKVELISREYIGVVELYCQMTGTKLVMQSASQGKHFMPNEKLDTLGILVKPQHPNRHKNDALRHLVRYQIVSLGIREPLITSHKERNHA
jgi:hypothetical protein